MNCLMIASVCGLFLQISIQRAAVWLLDKYYADFPIYNPYLERLPPRRARSKLHNSSSFKFYDIDAQNSGTIQVSGRTQCLRTAQIFSWNDLAKFKEKSLENQWTVGISLNLL
jgi:hypothetical protein